MKLEMELKPGDIVLLKLLACVLILFFMARFLIFPGIEKHQDLVQKKDDVTIEQQEMQQTIDSASITQAKIEKQQAQLDDSTKGYYQLMENQQIDELISGLILKHDLFPVYLNISEAVPGIPSAYQVQTQDTNADTSTTTSAEDELNGDSNSDSDTTDSSTAGDAAMIQYVNTTTVSVTLQGSEGQVRALLDELYPENTHRKVWGNEDAGFSASGTGIAGRNGQILPNFQTAQMAQKDQNAGLLPISPRAQVILDTLKKHGGNREQTAKELGVSKSTLWRLMKKYQINW